MAPTGFEIDPRLARDSLSITQLPLSNVRLMNNKHYPWIILVPRQPDLREWIDLSREDQHRLSDEIAVISHLLNALTTPDKLNVAALGNQVEQLHVHIIARYRADNAWPNPVWGSDSTPYSDAEAERFIREWKTALDSLQLT